VTFNRLAIALLFIAIAAAACLMPAQNDTFWHLRAGYEAWHGGSPLYRDIFSHTAYGQYWPNHEWLTQVAFFATYTIGGLPAMTVFCAAIVTSAWAMSFRMMRGTTTVRVCLVAAVIPASAALWSLRPQAISLGFVSLCAWLIASSSRRTWMRGFSPAAFIAIPLVCAIWANFHGAALFAVVLLAGALAGALICDRARARELSIALALAIGAMCLTPLGVRWWPEMIVSLARIRSISISEWQPPSVLQPADIAFWLVAIALLAFTWRRRHHVNGNDAIVIGMAMAMLPLAISAGRNVSPFLLVALPALTRVLPGPALRWEVGLARRPARLAHTWAVSCGAATAALVVGFSWSAPASRLGWRPLPTSVVAAVDACPGNLYNRYDDGGFFIWFTPAQRVFLDGRQDPYPVQLIQDHRATETVGAYRDIFRRFGIRCAALPSSSVTAVNLLHAGWHPTARDGGWIVLTE
jgi:hypothetical protein